MVRRLKTSHLHSDEFKSSSSYSRFCLQEAEAETGRQAKHDGFAVPVLGKPRKEDWHSLPQSLQWYHCRSSPSPHVIPMTVRHREPISIAHGLQEEWHESTGASRGGSGWASLNGFHGRGRAEDKYSRVGNRVSRMGGRSEEGLAALNLVSRFGIWGLFVCLVCVVLRRDLCPGPRVPGRCLP